MNITQRQAAPRTAPSVARGDIERRRAHAARNNNAASGLRNGRAGSHCPNTGGKAAEHGYYKKSLPDEGRCSTNTAVQ